MDNSNVTPLVPKDKKVTVILFLELVMCWSLKEMLLELAQVGITL